MKTELFKESFHMEVILVLWWVMLLCPEPLFIELTEKNNQQKTLLRFGTVGCSSVKLQRASKVSLSLISFTLLARNKDFCNWGRISAVVSSLLIMKHSPVQGCWGQLLFFKIYNSFLKPIPSSCSLFNWFNFQSFQTWNWELDLKRNWKRGIGPNPGTCSFFSIKTGGCRKSVFMCVQG